MRLERYERRFTGGRPHIGHLVCYVDDIEGWRFMRCRCGFCLGWSPSQRMYWLRTANVAIEITSLTQLLMALANNCWAHPRPKVAAALEPSVALEPAAPVPTSVQSMPTPAPALEPAPVSKPVPASKPAPKPLLRTYTPSTPRGVRKHAR